MKVTFYGTRGSIPVPAMESECKKRFESAFLAIEGQTIEF